MKLNPVDVAMRFEHRPPPSPEVTEAHERVRFTTKRAELDLLHVDPPGREQSLALTKLEEAMFWANAAIARAGANITRHGDGSIVQTGPAQPLVVDDGTRGHKPESRRRVPDGHPRRRARLRPPRTAPPRRRTRQTMGQ